MADISVLYAAIFVAILVAVILAIGIGSFGKGGEFNRKHSNRLMRYRLAAQAVAIALLMLFVYLRSRA